MKVKVFLILVGVAALHLLLIAGFAITGGCKGPEIFAERKYIPAEGATTAPVAPVTETKPVVTPEPSKVLTPETPIEQPVAQVKTQAKHVAAGGTYTVQSGDSLGKIARKHGVTVQNLAAANNMTTQKMLKIGQVLTIPSGSVAASYTAEHKKATAKKKTESKAKAAKVAKKEDASKDSAKSETKTATSSDSGTYIVKQGDSIWKIAKKLNVKGTDLAKENNLTTKTTLKVGQKLIVPGAAKTAEAATPAVATEATAETKKTETSADDILNKVSDPNPTAKPADPTVTPTDATTASPVDTKAADPEAAPAAGASAPTAVAPIGKTDTVEVSKDIEISKFAQQYGIKVDDIQKLNNDIPKDGILKAGKIIIIPSAE